MISVTDFSAALATGDNQNLSEFSGKVLLIVNTASKCGFTSQYTGLEHLHQRFSARGFSVLAFPCNQFGGQEPGSNVEIKEFALECYNAQFPLMAKSEVNGRFANETFKYLRRNSRLYDAGKDEARVVPWNFTKFVVNLKTMEVNYFNPRTEPAEVIACIESILKE